MMQTVILSEPCLACECLVYLAVGWLTTLKSKSFFLLIIPSGGQPLRSDHTRMGNKREGWRRREETAEEEEDSSWCVAKTAGRERYWERESKMGVGWGGEIIEGQHGGSRYTPGCGWSTTIHQGEFGEARECFLRNLERPVTQHWEWESYSILHCNLTHDTLLGFAAALPQSLSMLWVQISLQHKSEIPAANHLASLKSVVSGSNDDSIVTTSLPRLPTVLETSSVGFFLSLHSSVPMTTPVPWWFALLGRK